MESTSVGFVSVTINGRSSSIPKGTTVLKAARDMGVAIPTLCHYRGMPSYGACRVCIVELETPNGPRQVASCSYPLEMDAVITTDTSAIRESRKNIIQLLLAQAPDSPELAEFAAELGVESTAFDISENKKCILCGLCVRTCNELMGRGAISMFGRGAGREVRPAYGEQSDQCQTCGACSHVCPTGAIDLKIFTSKTVKPHQSFFDQYLDSRPNIEMAHPQSAPRVPAIDYANCVKQKTGECGLCAEVCQAGAINYEQKEEIQELDVGAVVLSPGYNVFKADRRGEFGFGHARNVLTSIQYERFLSASGPTEGHLLRPSDQKAPKKIAFIQCVGSRDSSCGNEYCSSICCMATTKQAILTREHEPDSEVTVFFLDMRAFGKDFDRYYNRAKNEMGVRYIRSFISRTYEMPDTKNLGVVYLDSAMKLVEEEFDMVVLSVGLEPSESLRRQADAIGIDLNTWGFAQTGGLTPLDTSREGVYVGGAFQEPKDIPDTVMQSTGAAARAMTLLTPARGSLVRAKIYPPERDITDEPPRIGVFVCHCGSNIASVVDVKKVTEYARTLPNVAFADHSVYACADDSQDMIKDIIKEHQLNRIIIASCTPRTHEPIFRDTLRDAGLNPYLLEMANIRDQCSWVHSDDHEAATEKSMQLVKMTIGRTANLVSLKDSKVPVKPGALVIGGGIAGMSAALALSSQGFPVHLVEKSDQLGGLMHHLHRTVEGDDMQAYLKNSIEQVVTEPKINVYLNAQAKQVNGHIGEFKSIITDDTQDYEIEHGVVVVATGANEKKPATYGYGSSESILTQLELSDKLGNGGVDIPDNGSVVMIQCVEQRNEEHPYCSRVCCTTAIKNALQIKEAKPDANIVIMYRDIRTYGFKEIVYKEAREKGILFVRYNEDEPPVLKTDKGLLVSVKDLSLDRTIEINPDLLVLAAPIRPQEDRGIISELLKVPLNADGFFLEAHVKLRPVDFASEGLFLCGTAHAPKFVKEVIAQANAVAGRAGSILSRREMVVSGQIAWVDPNKCISCMTCVHVCPYMAPMVGRDNKAEIQNAVCMGCGSCTAACPAKAVTLHHYVDTQVLGAIDHLLKERPEERKEEPVFLEKVGVALPKWHRK